MKNLVKMGIFALAFGLFAVACNNPGSQSTDGQSETPSVEQRTPANNPEQVMPPVDTSATFADSTSTDDNNGM